MTEKIILPENWKVERVEDGNIYITNERLWNITQLTPECQMKVVAKGVNWHKAKELEKENPGWRLPNRYDLIKYEQELYNYFKKDKWIRIWSSEECYLLVSKAWVLVCEDGYTSSCVLWYGDKEDFSAIYRVVLIKD